MNESKISVRYAKALYQSAKEKNLINEVLNDLKFLDNCIHELPELRMLLNAPNVPISDKKRVLALSLKDQVQKLTMLFLDILVANRREFYLVDIIRNFIDLYKTAHNLKSLQLITALAIDDAMQQKMLDLVKKTFQSEIEFSSSVDPNLLGGFVIKVDNSQYDASIKAQLTKMKRELV